MGDGVPDHVEKELRNYLKCGIPAHGSARARCPGCGPGCPVAFSCKGRGACPSCSAKRMAETAAHLVGHVFPHVPVRQWVLSVPKRLRPFLHHRPRTATAGLHILLRALQATLQEACSTAPASASVGAVNFLHRFGSSAFFPCAQPPYVTLLTPSSKHFCLESTSLPMALWATGKPGFSPLRKEWAEKPSVPKFPGPPGEELGRSQCIVHAFWQPSRLSSSPSS
jgi:hypothetical protein